MFEPILPDVELRVLSIDVLIDKDAGDLSKPGTVSIWSVQIRAGRVAAVGGGAPMRNFFGSSVEGWGLPSLAFWIE
eukprot:1828208-Pyramimonas_sp.AAC.1